MFGASPLRAVVTAFALPQIQRGLAISEDDVASLFALLRIGSLFSIVLAVLADRMGRRRLLIASVAGWPSKPSEA